MTNLTDIKSLALYHYQSCPFCSATRDVIEQLGLNIELRNIHLQVEHFIDLVSGGGKAVMARSTQMLVDILSKDPATTVVVIDEVNTDNWGVGGKVVTQLRAGKNKQQSDG